MCMFVPEPIKDLYDNFSMTYTYQTILRSSLTSETDMERYQKLQLEADLFVVSCFARISIAAVAIFAIVATQSYIPIAIAAVCSLPAAVIAAGSMYLYSGVTTLVAAVAAPALATVGMSFLLLGAGWQCLNKYLDVRRLGILESHFLTPRPVIDDYEQI